MVLINFVCRAFIGEKADVNKNINKIISQCARLYFPKTTNRPNIAACTKYDDFPDQTKLEVQAEFLVSKISFFEIGNLLFLFFS